MAPSLNIAITAALQGDVRVVDKYFKARKSIALKTTRERRRDRYKRDMRDELIGKPWRDLTLKERAQFVSRYEWDSSLGKGRYVRRKKRLSEREVYRDMVDKSKRMRRMGKRIGKQGARMRRRYSPLAAVAKSAYDTVGMFVTFSEYEDSETLLQAVLARGMRKKIEASDLSYFKNFFSRPQNVELLQIGHKKLLLVTEATGVYTFNGPRSILDKIAYSLESHSRSHGYDVEIGFTDYTDDREHKAKINSLLT